MQYLHAVTHYRDAARDDYRPPDPRTSTRHGRLWHLKDARGTPIAIVSDSGQVLRPGTTMTFPAGV